MEEVMSDHEEKEEINASLDEDDEPGPSNQVRMTTYTTDESTSSSGKLIYPLKFSESRLLHDLAHKLHAWYIGQSSSFDHGSFFRSFIRDVLTCIDFGGVVIEFKFFAQYLLCNIYFKREKSRLVDFQKSLIFHSSSTFNTSRQYFIFQVRTYIWSRQIRVTSSYSLE